MGLGAAQQGARSTPRTPLDLAWVGPQVQRDRVSGNPLGGATIIHSDDLSSMAAPVLHAGSGESLTKDQCILSALLPWRKSPSSPCPKALELKCPLITSLALHSPNSHPSAGAQDKQVHHYESTVMIAAPLRGTSEPAIASVSLSPHGTREPHVSTTSYHSKVIS